MLYKFIVWAFNVQTQYEFGIVQIESLQLYFVLLSGFSLFGKLQDSLNKLMKNS